MKISLLCPVWPLLAYIHQIHSLTSAQWARWRHRITSLIYKHLFQVVKRVFKWEVKTTVQHPFNQSIINKWIRKVTTVQLDMAVIMRIKVEEYNWLIKWIKTQTILSNSIIINLMIEFSLVKALIHSLTIVKNHQARAPTSRCFGSQERKKDMKI